MSKIKNNEITHASNTGTSNIILGSSGEVTPSKLKFGSDAAGDIAYYNGTGYARLAPAGASKTLKMNSSNNAPEWVTVSGGVITPTAMTAWTSMGTGTACDITGIAAGAVKLQLLTYEWSWGSNANFAIRLGDSGGFEDTNYISSGWSVGSSTAGATNTDRWGSDDAADANYKMSWWFDFEHVGSNKWMMWGRGHCNDNGNSRHNGYGMAATKTLSGELTQLRLFNDTFDSGQYRLITWT